MKAALTPLAALLAVLSVWAPQPACAAEHSISYSLWVVDGDSVLLRYTLPKEELRYLVPAGWPSPATASVASYLLERITVQSAAGACPAIDQGYDIGRVDPLAAGPGLYSYEILYRCTDPRGLTLSNTALFERAPHTDFARVQINGSEFVPVLFTAGRQQLRLPDTGPPSRASAASYLRQGGAHVLHDLEGACFLIAVALLLRRREELVYVAAGLALGYVAATVLAAVNLALLRPAAGEAWTGLLVACVAIAAVIPHGPLARRLPLAAAAGLGLLAGTAALLRQPQATLLLAGAALFTAGFLQWCTRSAAPAQRWLLPTILFGLVDGFVLPADWNLLGIAALMPTTGLAAFNAGVLLADGLLCAAAVGAIALLKRSRAAALGPLATDLSAAALVGLGMFWLVSQVGLR
jgi:hypothetical protein